MELAHAVRASGDRVSVPLQRAATAVLGGNEDDVVVGAASIGELDRFSESITDRYASELRKRARLQPRNGFHWHDLSYALNLLGDKDGAESAMRAAIQVSGSHRLIVRSAARLYLHHDGRKDALSVIERAGGVAKDPWLLSAHLAISQGGGRSSRFSVAARQLVEGRKSLSTQHSELGMAVATQEVMSGRSKKAKQLIAASSIHPTENALAQAVWLSHQLSLPVADSLKNQSIEQDAAFEAKCWSSFYRGDWALAAESAIGWLIDEPFSTRPATQGSFLASTFLRDHVLAERFAVFGLRMNPGDWVLRNNLVVALAEQDRIVEAGREFLQLAEPSPESENYAVYCATGGLLSYRRGFVGDGRDLYARAMSSLVRSRNRSSQMILALYQSAEEMKAGNFVMAKEILGKVPAFSGVIADKESVFSRALELELQRAVARIAIDEVSNPLLPSP
ncbi:hypothetical protein [Arenimonas sp. SCN 70-307]|uniref:hypothetical protein n=1 Tax=Arenimonas sp. SCN 70-307 TaxID=1660089 RepID=UPI0025C2DC5A|nr:hypothetical protein [Arenimonas sp. SCN 70-307]